MFDRLPIYPWEKLRPFAELAKQHAGGMVDLSIGSPVDPTPAIIQNALNEFSNSPGYPSAVGSAELRSAIVEWFARRRNVAGLSVEQVMPSIGSKELISFLPLLLGLGKGDVIVQPTVAYTAYVVGAAFVDAEIINEDDPAKWPANTKLVWLNSPGNPDGRVLTVEQMKAAVDRARELGAVVASDECYAELGWDDWYDKLIPSVLDPRVCGADHTNLIALYSLSKQSNMAGHRAAFAAGDQKLIKSIVNLRMHAGLNTPAPVQHAIAVALGDYEHVVTARETYRKRREVLLPAVKAYGFEVTDSEAGLYIWATLGEDSWATVKRMAELGILVGPGSIYGEAGSQHIRFALTATDANISEAARRLSMP